MNPFKQQFDPNREEIKLKKAELNMYKSNQLYDLANAAVDPNELPVEGQAKADLTKWQQDMDYELVKMAMGLRNYYQDIEGNWSPKLDIDGEPIPPLCSEESVAELIEILRPYTSRNLMMSNYNEDFIRNKLIELSNAVTLLIISRRKHFNIRMNNLTPIIKIFQGAAEPTFYRALQGNEKRYLGSINKYIYAHQEKPEEDKKAGLIPKWGS